MNRPPAETIEQEAAAWCARVRGDMEVSDWAAFAVWLDASPRHREVYDAIEAFWDDLEAPRRDASSASTPPVSRPARRRASEPRGRRRRIGLGWSIGALAAAALIGAFFLARPPQAPWEDQVTAPGQIRSIALDDGSRLTLGPATRIRVRLADKSRQVELVQGACAFDVAHEPARPFEVTAGDRRVRVLGTEFDVIRRDGGAQITVLRGLVAVADLDGRRPVRLARGERLTHRAGAQVDAITLADADRAIGWTRGQLYYDDVPLAEVAADFSRYGARKVRVDPGAAGVRVTGVFKQDEQTVMVRRLESFAAVRARFGADVIHLQAR